MNRDEVHFENALRLPPAERAAYLARECGDDPALRQRVERLLQASDSAGDFLEGVPPPPTAPGVSDPEMEAGMRVARYKILQKIGEGGCGVVFMVEQEEPVRRRLALKVIKLGMDTKAVIARFEAERHALSLMDHPNIARVVDAGATEHGRPFFVMELVRGIPITRYCDEHNLSTRQRLELFLDVCSGVQHAHQKGVIHRDLKPSNILVTLHDGQPVPKVIDFGVAKATHGRLTNQTLFTAFEQFIGTPAYMSPEQAEMSGLDIDTRSDIYSLGVLLYELLSGRPPFDPKTFSSAGIDEIRRVIREVEPPPPSSRLGTLAAADRTTIARVRATVPAHLQSVLRGDLDWIVMKALEKNRSRRYDTANGFAMDIRRYLRNEPILARPPSTAYLLQKLVHRHRLAFSVAGVLLAGLVAGLTILAGQYQREVALRRTLQDNESALKYLVRLIGPLTATGENLELTGQYLDHTSGMLAANLSQSPLQKAALLETLGEVAFNSGDLPRARKLFEESLELRIRAPEAAAIDIARSRNYRALALSALVTQERSRQMMQPVPAGGTPVPLPDDPRLVQAENDLRLAIEALAGVEGATAAADLARSRSNLGWILAQRRQWEKAEAELRLAIRAQSSGGTAGKLDLAQSYKRLGLVQIRRDQLPEAVANLETALETDKQAFGTEAHVEVASDYNFLAVALAIQDRNTNTLIPKAIKAYYEAIAIREGLKSGSHEARMPSSSITNMTRQGTLDEVTSLMAEARAYAQDKRDERADRWLDSYYFAIPAFAYTLEKQYATAVVFATECYKLRLSLDPTRRDWRVLNAQCMLGGALLGRASQERNAATIAQLLGEAGAHLNEAYRGFRDPAATLPPGSEIWVGDSIANLLLFSAATGRREELATLYAELRRWERSTEDPLVREIVLRRLQSLPPAVRATLEAGAQGR